MAIITYFPVKHYIEKGHAKALEYINNNIPFSLLHDTNMDSSFRPLKFIPFSSPAIIMEQHDGEFIWKLYEKIIWVQKKWPQAHFNWTTSSLRRMMNTSVSGFEILIHQASASKLLVCQLPFYRCINICLLPDPNSKSNKVPRLTSKVLRNKCILGM